MVFIFILGQLRFPEPNMYINSCSYLILQCSVYYPDFIFTRFDDHPLSAMSRLQLFDAHPLLLLVKAGLALVFLITIA